MIRWYLKYAWVKLNILILSPLVWIENKNRELKEKRLELIVASQCVNH